MQAQTKRCNPITSFDYSYFSREMNLRSGLEVPLAPLSLTYDFLTFISKVLVNQLEQSLKQIIRDICAAQEIEVEEMKTDKDPIHLHISLKPQHSIPSVVKTLKGKSARRRFKLYPEMKQSLWGGRICGTLDISLRQSAKILRNKCGNTSKANIKTDRR